MAESRQRRSMENSRINIVFQSNHPPSPADTNLIHPVCVCVDVIIPMRGAARCPVARAQNIIQQKENCVNGCPIKKSCPGDKSQKLSDKSKVPAGVCVLVITRHKHCE